jgi:hypothetical protein
VVLMVILFLRVGASGSVALLWLLPQPRVSRVLKTGAHRFRETEALRCLFDFRGRLSKY